MIASMIVEIYRNRLITPFTNECTIVYCVLTLGSKFVHSLQWGEYYSEEPPIDILIVFRMKSPYEMV